METLFNFLNLQLQISLYKVIYNWQLDILLLNEFITLLLYIHTYTIKILKFHQVRIHPVLISTTKNVVG